MRIRAFTLLEMIINLALMGVVVGMVYVIHGFVWKNTAGYSDIMEEHVALQSFYTQMQEDFYRCDRIVSTNGRDISALFYDETLVQYRWNNNHVFRIAGRSRDSIPVMDMEIGFLESSGGNTTERRVKKIRLVALLHDKQVPLGLYKNYLSNHYITEE